MTPSTALRISVNEHDMICRSGERAENSQWVAEVLMPLPLSEPFDYRVPDDMCLGPGDHVMVPLGPRQVQGLVARLKAHSDTDRKLKPISQKLALTPLPEKALAFVVWAARWTLSPPGEMALAALRGLRAPQAKLETQVLATGQRPTKLTPARARVMAILDQDPGPYRPAKLVDLAGVSASVLKGLEEDGVILRQFWRDEGTFLPPNPDHAPAGLNPAQEAAADQIHEDLLAQDFSPILLDGVTGSGKTEVYLEVIARLMREDEQAQFLILLPEIALTQAALDRFEARFGVRPAQWHSGISGPQRRQTWEAVADGRCRIVLGARSGLYLPFQSLRLIVVDEEHDGSYKQEEGLVYQARDLAVARAKIEGAGVILASATPSLETLWNAEQGRYFWVRLTDRHGVAVLPDIELIDMRQNPPERGQWLSGPLVTALKETYAAGEQSLLFLNRRGYAPLVLCKACGQKLTAPDTDSWLVEHRYTGRLVCHLTGFSMPKPKACPHCGTEDSLTAIGPGVERIEEEVKALFPEARVMVFSSDTLTDPQAARDMVEAMAGGEVDILVATQAAAKGHNFPRLTLVGVVDSDLGLRGGDLRAAERTYQLLAQATGRAGRADRPGRALLQTYAPEHAVMQALVAQDRDAFVEAELHEREVAGLPPFGRLAALVLSSENAMALEAFCKSLAAVIPNADGVDVYGPADAPLSLVRGRRRKRFLVRAGLGFNLQGFVKAWLSRIKVPANIRLQVDIDPYSFL